MTDIKAAFNKYRTAQLSNLTGDQVGELEQVLEQLASNELRTLDEHKSFIELLAFCRLDMVKQFRRAGRDFMKMLESLLSVGEDGVYSNSLRFIYELIQNVDDCDYIDAENCKLDIAFNTIKDTIVLSYNEVGFTPENVFSITGIAGGTKNISADKVEIGEKGIGFKSVFGIASWQFCCTCTVIR